MNDEKVIQSVGRGRPKGSVDTVVRKKRSDREMMVSEGDNAKITLHNMELTLISIRGLSTRPNLTKCCPTRELWTILINMFPISTLGL